MDYLDEDSTWDFDIQEFLEQSQSREKKRIEAELERISQQLEERDQVHQELVDELESKLDWYTSRLETLYKQMRGRQGKRSQVKNRIKELYQELRTEKQQVWKDKQELERERRQLIKNLDEMSVEDILLDEL